MSSPSSDDLGEMLPIILFIRFVIILSEVHFMQEQAIPHTNFLHIFKSKLIPHLWAPHEAQQTRLALHGALRCP